MTRNPGLKAFAARAVDARKSYGEGEAAVHALAGVSVDFPAHRFTAIMGPSGSGKSTLMQCVAGLDRLTSGEAYVGDTEIARCRRPSWRCCGATGSGSSSSSTT
jgi:putative ABC transport system ATP-binding protein